MTGEYVIFADKEAHNIEPRYYPEPGTIGRVIGYTSGSRRPYCIKWPEGTTGGTGRCYCRANQIVSEWKLSPNEEEVEQIDKFFDEF